MSKAKKASQPQSFESAAKALGCDEDESRFNAALGKIARAKPADPPANKPKPEKTKPGQ